MQHDVIVIGGGPGGYVAAIRAAQLGMNAAVVEREHLGGICLNWGCIPTKALLRSAEIMHWAQHASEYGITLGSIAYDTDKIVARSRTVAQQLSGGIKHLLRKNKVTVYDGHARLKGQGKLGVEQGGKEITLLNAKHIILATGARARSLPNLTPDGKNIWTYKEAMVPQTMPQSLLVIGSGAIGIEFASFYAAFGSKVTVVELLDRILPNEDEEISIAARKAFEKRGIKIVTKASVTELASTASGVKATLQQAAGTAETQNFDKAILAIGILGNTENLGLENTKVKVEKGHIQTNEWCETAEKGIYAIGDVAGPPWLAHKASHEGILCVEKIAGLKNLHPLNPTHVPGCTYSHPQIASVGLTEAKAKAAGRNIKVGRFPLLANGKAIALGEPEGLIKTIFDADSGELLGAHMIGPEVTEMIQGFAIAQSLETTEAELMHTIFPHPTLSEAMHEAVLDAYGRVIHY